jgi:hypothetical protein
MVTENTLRNGNRYRIFFQPAAGSMDSGTTIRSSSGNTL